VRVLKVLVLVRVLKVLVQLALVVAVAQRLLSDLMVQMPGRFLRCLWLE
jgi:hypothetical protein